MNTEKLLKEVLAQHLTTESISRLNELWLLIIRNTENSPYSELSEAISQNKMIHFIFHYAKNQQPGKTNSIFSDYMDSREIILALGISYRTLAEWRASGILTYIVHRNKCYYRIADMLKLLERNYFGATT